MLGMTAPAANRLLDRILPVVRQHLPPGVSPAYLDAFLARHRSTLVAILDRQLQARAQPGATPDLWSASQRTAANLAAMRIAASKRPDEMTADDRKALAAYSGWGGLSIQAAAPQFPTGFPVPEERGLIHERVRSRNFWQPAEPTSDRPWSCSA